jgi:hypothetical protein
VADVLLHRPAFAVAPRQNLRRHAAQQKLGAGRSAAQALQHVRKHPVGQAERELALEPCHVADHV